MDFTCLQKHNLHVAFLPESRRPSTWEGICESWFGDELTSLLPKPFRLAFQLFSLRFPNLVSFNRYFLWQNLAIHQSIASVASVVHSLLHMGTFTVPVGTNNSNSTAKQKMACIVAQSPGALLTSSPTLRHCLVSLSRLFSLNKSRNLSH